MLSRSLFAERHLFFSKCAMLFRGALLSGFAVLLAL
ncbi:hypothetical protein DSM3645_03163 [Blastopirellula marina DSM 3645]|uniref:Uncharacterized protein n=1 Tax=Blastopirellula marina DSM 3645 TaxID=314230 RepID=A3ZVU6_9BACT|nr:hypothetical protein DSM3645_03163 [Blastopirellula marina DSM 3645]